MVKRVRTQEESSLVDAANRHWVYLATTTSDVQDERDRIKRELLERGHVVLPDAPLPMVSSNVETSVQQYLTECTIAIHLLGRHYGVTPEDSSESIPALQVRMTADWAQNSDLQRLVWLAGDEQSEDERQRAFIERVQEDPVLHHCAEIIEGNLNLLKKDLIRRLTPVEEKPKPTENSQSSGGAARLYLICDQRDEADVESLEDYLFFGREEQTIELLSRLAENRFVVVLTMRSDFIGECGQFEGLAEMVNRGEFLIPRLNREQYKRVIEGPVKVAGGEITPRLLQRLLNDLGQQADQLPCLQHALMRTWNVWAESGSDGALDLDDYQRVGKMTQALSLQADEVYESLGSDRQRDLCRGLFQALTLQESENRGIRRPQRLDRLCQILEVGADELMPVIDAYRQSGVTFLMPPADVELTDRTIIDISHESLMRVWNQLRFWVEEEAQAAGIYRRLSESAALHRQGEAGLYRDPELGIALAWKQENRPNQAWAERYRPGFDSAMKFLEASEEAERAEAEASEAARQRELAQAKQLADVQRRSARRLRWMVSGLAVVALLAVVATINAVRARRAADDAKIAALASEDRAIENAGRAQREAERALAQEAAAKKAEEAATAAKSEAEAATDAFEQQLYQSDMPLADHSYDEGNVGRVTQMLLDDVPAVDATDDPRGFEWFHLWAGAHRVSKTFQPDRGTGADTQARFGVPVLALAVSPDGGKGAASYRDGVAVFDMQTYEVLSVLDPASPIRSNAYIALSFSPDGERLAAVTEEGHLQVWAADTHAAVRRRTTSTFLRGVSFSSSDPLLASGGLDGYVYLWDTQTWEQLELSEGVGLPIECLAFSPDGTHIAIGTQAATSDSEGITAGHSMLFLWDVAKREIVTTRSDHDGSIQAVSWSPDGQSVVSAGIDGFVRIWDSDLSLLHEVNASGPVQTVAFSPDGSLLAVGMTRANTVRILAADT